MAGAALLPLLLAPLPSAHAPALRGVDASIHPELRIYVYEPFGNYTDMMALARRHAPCRESMFAADYQIVRRLLGSPYRTRVAPRAHFFVVPLPYKCVLSQEMGGDMRGALAVLRAALAQLERRRAWREAPERHLFFFMSASGPTLIPDPPGWRGLGAGFARAIKVSCEGDREAPYFRYGHDITVPAHVREGAARGGGAARAAEPARERLLVFRGKLHHSLKDASGRAVRVRNELRSALRAEMQSEPDVLISEQRLLGKEAAGFFSELRTAHFCLAPRGNGPFTGRLFDALAHGCVPVIVDDPIQLPYERFVNWGNFSFKVAERRAVAGLAGALRDVGGASRRALRAGVRRWRGAFSWARGGGAFELFLIELSLRLNCSLGVPARPARPATLNSPHHFWPPPRGALVYDPGATKLGPTWEGGLATHRTARRRLLARRDRDRVVADDIVISSSAAGRSVGGRFSSSVARLAGREITGMDDEAAAIMCPPPPE